MFIEFSARAGLTAADIKTLVTVNTEEMVHYRVKKERLLELRLTSTVIQFAFGSEEAANKAREDITEKIMNMADTKNPMGFINLQGCKSARIFERGEWSDLIG